jgi:hypothetical protein
MKGVGNERVTWGDYLEGLCARFGGQKDPLKELMELRQVGNLETYIQDFDVLWNRADISDKQALVFFCRWSGG